MEKYHKKLKDLKNKVFGKWTVLSFHGLNGKRKSVWNCVCECSNLQQVSQQSLRKKNNNCKKCGRRRDHNQESINKLFITLNWHSYQKNARRRGYAFLLTKETFKSLIFSNCFYCSFKGTKKNTYSDNKIVGEVICNGIDRIDNNYGYFETNCVPCCGTCNMAKSSMSQSDFESYLDRIAFSRLKKNPHKFYHILQKPLSAQVA